MPMYLAKHTHYVFTVASIIVFSLAPTRNAVAIVNMESLHLGTPEQGFNGNIDIAVSGASGNTDKSEIAAGTRLEWQYDRHTDYVVNNYSHAEVSGATNTDKLFLHLRHITQMEPFYAVEGYAQLERDKFARLDSRGLIGAGTRLTLIERSDSKAAFLGLGAMYVSERLTEQAGTNDAGSEQLWRANSYLVLKYRLRDGVMLVNSLYYQPAVRDFQDYRLLDALTLQVKIADNLAVQLDLNVAHDSLPPETVERTDVIYRTGLSWSF
jgi:putative salt-induced outer membrane protein YdiY